MVSRVDYLSMAKKKRRSLMDKLQGSPFERLNRQIEKIAAKADDPDELASELVELAKNIRRAFREEDVDAEEHDLLMEYIEEADPQGREFDKVSAQGDEFYSGGSFIPNAPDLEVGSEVDLDELMRSDKKSFTGGFARDEYDEAKARLAEEFYRESDEAMSSGSSTNRRQLEDPMGRRFGDAEEEVQEARRRIADEMRGGGQGRARGARDRNRDPEPRDNDEYDDGYDDEYDDAEYDDGGSESEDDDRYHIEEDGTEWWCDDDDQWWFRLPDAHEDDWQAFEE